MVTVVVTGHSSSRSTPPRWTPTGKRTSTRAVLFGRRWAKPLAASGQLHGRHWARSHGRRHPAKHGSRGLTGKTPVSGFNGGPDNRPAKHGSRGLTERRRSPSFNGGPDNRPARPGAYAARSTRADRGPSMEGPDNCPGQTPAPAGRNPVLARPSMEGRTIARPNQRSPSRNARSGAAFNGGPTIARQTAR